MHGTLVIGALIVRLLISSTVAFAQLSGEVISVLDGDTIEVMHGRQAERIRLNGIDCPERGQAYGTKAKQAVSALLFGKEVTLSTHGFDKYGRTIADVLLSNGTNINHELVKEGWCWWYQKYALNDATLARLESEARKAQRGLWADPQPVPPWEYRKAVRGKVRSVDRRPMRVEARGDTTTVHAAAAL